MSSPNVALRFMTRFRCITDRCEDSCCTFSRIILNQRDVERLEQHMSAEGVPVTQHVELLPNGTPREFATLRKGQRTFCTFFNHSNQLCTVHERFGEGALSDVCMLFPRKLSRRGERVEMGGSMACPEAVRLALLAEDGVDEVPIPEGALPRPEAAVQQVEPSSPAHVRHHVRLREAMRRVLAQHQFPLASRLAFLALLGYRVDTALAQADTAPFEQERLEEALRCFDEPSELEGMHRAFRGMSVDPLPSLDFCLSVVRRRLIANFGKRMDTLTPTLLTSLGVGTLEAPALEAVWRSYSERSTRIQAAQGKRLEQYFRHYLINALYLPTEGSPTLGASIADLIAQLALTHLLLMGHPQLVALCTQPPESPQQAQALLDLTAVEVFQMLHKDMVTVTFLPLLKEQEESTRRNLVLSRTLALAKLMSTDT